MLTKLICIKSVVSSINDSIAYVFCIGEKSKWIFEEIKETLPNLNAYFTLSSTEVVKEIRPLLNENTVVMAKASRGLHLDKIIQRLQQ